MFRTGNFGKKNRTLSIDYSRKPSFLNLTEESNPVTKVNLRAFFQSVGFSESWLTNPVLFQVIILIRRYS